MKIALVSIHIERSSRALPLGCAMISSALKKNLGGDFAPVIINLYMQMSAEECADEIMKRDADYVGFSMFVWNRNLCLRVASILKKRKSSVVIFAGGPEATADFKNIRSAPSIDFVLPGEGEEIIVDAFKRISSGESAASIGGTCPASAVASLENLASPFLDGTLDMRDYSGALWELSRGCPFKCDFCYESRGIEGIRRFPFERIEAELDKFIEAGIPEVFVLDPTFNYSRDDAKKILRLISRRAPHIHFFFEIRSEFVDREMAGLFASIRCTLQIGLQSANDEVLRKINRSISRDDFESRMLLLHQAGAAYGFDLIYGLPGDSLDGFLDSVDYAMSLVPNHLDIFRLSVLPGTRLCENAASFEMKYEADNPYHVISTPTFSSDDMARAALVAEACDELYNCGRAVSWFDILQSAIGMKASEIFAAYADFRKDDSSSDIVEAQVKFFSCLFAGCDMDALAPLAADIINYFGYSYRLSDADESEGDFSAVVHYHYDPQELIENMRGGMTDLEEIVFSMGRVDRDFRMSLRDGSVVFESI